MAASSEILLVRRRRPIGERAFAPDSPANAGLVRGTIGVGRIALALAELGLPLDAAVQLVLDPDLDPRAAEGVDLRRRFDTVVLGSHLVNLPDERARRAVMALAGRHLDGGGRLLVEHHPVDWAETAEPTEPTPGATVGMERVRREPPFVSAVSVYDVGGRVVRQPFTARVLSEAELAATLTAIGLQAQRRLNPTWLEARRIHQA